MNIDDYIRLRSSFQNQPIFFEYYVEKGGSIKDYKTFIETFGHFLGGAIEKKVLLEQDIRHNVTLVFYNDKLIKIQKNGETEVRERRRHGENNQNV